MSEKIETGGSAFPAPLGCGPYVGMTLRQYAAIKLRVPNSGTDWLDEMIRESLRDELAGKAMQGMAGSSSYCEYGWCQSDLSGQAYEISDAMIKAREVKNGQG